MTIKFLFIQRMIHKQHMTFNELSYLGMLNMMCLLYVSLYLFNSYLTKYTYLLLNFMLNFDVFNRGTSRACNWLCHTKANMLKPVNLQVDPESPEDPLSA
jgi:hypothetical protein